MQQYPTLPNILLTIVFFGFSIGFLYFSHSIAGKVKNIEIIYPDNHDLYIEKTDKRDKRIQELTTIWRVAVIGEIICSSIGGFALAGIAGAIMIPILMGSDYLRNREPLQNINHDPLARIETQLNYISNRHDHPQTLLKKKISEFEIKRKMTLQQRQEFYKYLSNCEETVGRVADELLFELETIV